MNGEQGFNVGFEAGMDKVAISNELANKVRQARDANLSKAQGALQSANAVRGAGSDAARKTLGAAATSAHNKSYRNSLLNNVRENRLGTASKSWGTHIGGYQKGQGIAKNMAAAAKSSWQKMAMIKNAGFMDAVKGFAAKANKALGEPVAITQSASKGVKNVSNAAQLAVRQRMKAKAA